MYTGNLSPPHVYYSKQVNHDASVAQHGCIQCSLTMIIGQRQIQEQVKGNTRSIPRGGFIKWNIKSVYCWKWTKPETILRQSNEWRIFFKVVNEIVGGGKKGKLNSAPHFTSFPIPLPNLSCHDQHSVYTEWDRVKEQVTHNVHCIWKRRRINLKNHAFNTRKYFQYISCKLA